MIGQLEFDLGGWRGFPPLTWIENLPVSVDWHDGGEIWSVDGCRSCGREFSAALWIPCWAFRPMSIPGVPL